MVKYVTDDGKSFDTFEAAQAHDDKLLAKKTAEEKKLKEQKKRYEEVENAYVAWRTLLKKYEEDYKVYASYFDIF